MFLTSTYAAGDVAVDIVDKLPIEGVHMLLGNDLASGQLDVYCAM